MTRFIFLFVLMLIITAGTQLAQYSAVKYFEPVEGKYLGIWPHNERVHDSDKLRELKERWGFQHILLADIYDDNVLQNFNKAGFDSSTIMLQFQLPAFKKDKLKYKKKLAEIGRVAAYYYDEPISRKNKFTDLTESVHFLIENGFYPKGKIVLSELTVQKAKKIHRLSDSMLYSGYGNPGQGGKDQIRTWTEWKEILTDKFESTWISTLEDKNEFRELFESARDLGLKGIWLYALEPLPIGNEAGDEVYERFCEAAVEFGFLKVKYPEKK